MFARLNFELAMYSPIPDTNVKVRIWIITHSFVYVCYLMMSYNYILKIKYDDKHEKSQKRKTNAEKQQIYRKGGQFIKCGHTNYI